MVLEKRQLNLTDIEAQMALELPDRETPATVVFSCVAVCIGNITIKNINANIGAQVCALVNVINLLLNVQALSCTINQQAG